MNPFRLIFHPGLMILLAVFVGALVFYNSVPKCNRVRSDNIVVVTGDARRIPHAVNLLRRHKNGRMLVSGAGSHDLRSIIPSDLVGKVDVETKATTTFDNSIEIRDWVLSNGIKDIALVTSDYHIWRTLFLVKKQLPNTRIEICPIDSRNLNQHKRTNLWISEFFKYMMTVIGINTKAR
jgi:hypothetical protein